MKYEDSQQNQFDSARARLPRFPTLLLAKSMLREIPHIFPLFGTALNISNKTFAHWKHVINKSENSSEVKCEM